MSDVAPIVSDAPMAPRKKQSLVQPVFWKIFDRRSSLLTRQSADHDDNRGNGNGQGEHRKDRTVADKAEDRVCLLNSERIHDTIPRSSDPGTEFRHCSVCACVNLGVF